jgi:Zn-dependent metalloprotease
MLRITTLIALLTPFLLSAGDDHPTVDQELEITYIKNNRRLPDRTLQSQWKQQKAWQSFVQDHSNWYVEFNEITGLPHRAAGKPLAIAGATEQSAKQFLQAHFKGFNIPTQDLVLRNIRQSKNYTFIDLVQHYQGFEVIDSRVSLRINQSGRVPLVGIDVYPVQGVNLTASLQINQISSLAAAGLPGKVNEIKFEDLRILPVPMGDHYDYHLVYPVRVLTYDASTRMPAEWYTYLDAHSGKVLYRHNLVANAQVDITVQATVYPTHSLDPSAVRPLEGVRITTPGGAVYYTDSAGKVTLPDSITSITADLNGRWSTIRTGQSGTTAPSIVMSVDTGANLVNFDSATIISHSSAFHHVNLMHGFLKSWYPSFTGMDFPMLTRVDRTDGSCNAFYNGANDMISFFAAGSGCRDIATVADVVYHEYAHGINYEFYNFYSSFFQNGSMGEGYSDVWALGFTESPVLGKGFTSDPGYYVRRYDIDPKVYPDDVAGTHQTGEIIAGSWWDCGVAFADVQQMMEIYAEHMYALPTAPGGQEGQLFRDILLDALMADDDDGDLSNGSPNDSIIACNFATHGITLIPDANASHVTEETKPALYLIPIEIDLGSDLGWYYTGVTLKYKFDKSDPWTDEPMVFNSTSGLFEAILPGQPAGTVMQYYIELSNLCGTTVTIPEGADLIGINAALPYMSLIGYKNIYLENLSDLGTLWTLGDATDNATTGQWVIEELVGSFSGGAEVQPADDHTQNGDDVAAVTANSASQSAGIGTNDVDDGKTTLYSPVFDLRGWIDPAINYYRWYTNDAFGGPSADLWEVFITDDLVNWFEIERTRDTDRSWRNVAFKVLDYVNLTAEIQLKFVAQDNAPGSIVEAAVDDLGVWDLDLNPGIDENEHSSIQIWPNPSEGKLVIRSTTDLGQVRIMDLAGRVVFEQQARTGQVLSLDLSHLAAGLYFLETESGHAKVVLTEQN